MKIVKKLFFGLIILIGLFITAFILWGSTPAQAMPETVESMRSSSSVKVEAGKWLVFTPASGNAKTGYIFYPGGRVDFRAYAPYARAIAEQGVLVIVPRMPLNLAVFGSNSAKGILTAYPHITHWVIGGHSLGGSMAANYLAKNATQIDGLVLLASYPASSDDLTDYAGEVVSLSGSLDGLATQDKIESSRLLLPASTKWVVIQGGNHAYFGWYGLQKGDNAATISREEQQSITIQETIALLKKVDK